MHHTFRFALLPVVVVFACTVMQESLHLLIKVTPKKKIRSTLPLKITLLKRLPAKYALDQLRIPIALWQTFSIKKIIRSALLVLLGLEWHVVVNHEPFELKFLGKYADRYIHPSKKSQAVAFSCGPSVLGMPQWSRGNCKSRTWAIGDTWSCEVNHP